MRGLKYYLPGKQIIQWSVALLVSAWIEMFQGFDSAAFPRVALLVSAWIEIIHHDLGKQGSYRRTPRECVD